MAGVSARLGFGGEAIEINGDRFEKASSAATKAQRSPDKPFILEKNSRANPPELIISFPASGAVKDWYSDKSFGETKINLVLFPALRSIGNSEHALVNQVFQTRFENILAKSTLKSEVEIAMSKKKQIVFTGHSSGAAMAILATLWTLEEYCPQKSHGGIPPICITFGSPLIGNHIFSHATRRENWSRYFIHFVMRYDIAPRILLAPLSTFDQRFEPISQFFNPKSKSFMNESVAAAATSDFYFALMSKASTVTSHAACKLMGSTDATLETMANFIQLSPYRPFGTYIFCTGNGKEGKRTVIRNPDAVLQVLFFSAQLNTEAEAPQVAYKSLRDHLIYGTELQQMIAAQNVVYLEKLQNAPLSDDGSSISMALNELGLTTRARLCLRATAELEERRYNNEDRMKKKKEFVEEKMKHLKNYKDLEHQKVGYYDAFKVQENPEDFQANVKRLELAGVWDEIIELQRRYELPDEFEGNDEWIQLGTRFRRLVEPLDIANYYRHLRHHEAGSYMVQGRPKRYRYTQRWLEHSKRKAEETFSESSFWAEVEDLVNIARNNNGSFEDVRGRVLLLEANINAWSDEKEPLLGKDVFLKGSTLVNWWNSLPPQHKQESRIKNLIEA